MKLNSGVLYNEKGITASIRAMHLDSVLIGIHNDNVGGFDKVGYQRHEAVVSSFAEFMGIHALSTTKDDKVGRINISPNPLDIALANKGYFQTKTKDGIKLTRDGRFKIAKDGTLCTLEGAAVMSVAGTPIIFPFIPQDLKDVKIDRDGKVSMFNPQKHRLEKVGQLGIVDTHGAVVLDPNVKQGYNEYSNVSLQEEFITMMPIIKNFDANRQMFMLQNSVLGKTISQLSQ